MQTNDNQELINTALVLSDRYGMDPAELTLEHDGVAFRDGLMVALQDWRTLDFLRGAPDRPAWERTNYSSTVLSLYLAPLGAGLYDDGMRFSYFRVVAGGTSLDLEFLQNVMISVGWSSATITADQKLQTQRLVAGAIRHFGLHSYPGAAGNGDGCYVMGQRALLGLRGDEWIPELARSIDQGNPWPQRPGLRIGVVSQVLLSRREALERAQHVGVPDGSNTVDGRRFMTLLERISQAGASWSLQDAEELDRLQDLGLKIPNMVRAYADRCRLEDAGSDATALRNIHVDDTEGIERTRLGTVKPHGPGRRRIL